MAMLAPVHVKNFGRLYGSNQPISAHFTAFNSSDQLQRKRSSIFQEALIAEVWLWGFRHSLGVLGIISWIQAFCLLAAPLLNA
jgi:hypothetical protein